MRNKQTYKYAIFVAILVPFLAFSMSMASQEGSKVAIVVDDSQDQVKSTDDNSNTGSLKSPRQPVRPPLNKVDNRSVMKDDKTSDDDNGSDDDSLSESRRAEMRKQDEEKMAKVRETRVVAMKRIMANQISRSSKALDRLQQIIERIEARRAKLADSGADLTQVDALIVKAKNQKVEASTALEKAKTDLAALEPASETPQDSVKTFMASMKDLKTKLIALHKTLGETVRVMKRVVPRPEDDSSASGTSESGSPESGQSDTDNDSSSNN